MDAPGPLQIALCPPRRRRLLNLAALEAGLILCMLMHFEEVGGGQARLDSCGVPACISALDAECSAAQMGQLQGTTLPEMKEEIEHHIATDCTWCHKPVGDGCCATRGGPGIAALVVHAHV